MELSMWTCKGNFSLLGESQAVERYIQWLTWNCLYIACKISNKMNIKILVVRYRNSRQLNCLNNGPNNVFCPRAGLSLQSQA